MKIITSILVFFTTALLYSQSNIRFRIVENNKIGYINSKGEIVIKPIYANGGNFSDGVAAVRENGLYGFIDVNGNYVLKPQYDYVGPFYKGYAVTYKKGEKQLINTKGELVFSETFSFARILSENLAIMGNQTSKKGLYNLKDKKWICDTLYDHISEFKNNTAIAQINNSFILIDTTGHPIIPTGIYREIESFSEDGFAVVHFKENEHKQGVIDTNGRLLFTYENEYSHLRGRFNNGYIPVYDYSFSEKPANAKFDRGYLDARGKLIYSNPNTDKFENFSNQRAFIGNGDNYRLINENFEFAGDSVYDAIGGSYENNVFIGNYAIVESMDSGWGVIDTNGHYVIKPKFEEIHECGILDGWIFFREYDADDNAHYGICDLKDQIIFKPVLDYFDTNGFVNGLLITLIDDRLTYLNKQGGVIWQQTKPENDISIKPLNIDFMMRGYFYAYSKTEKNNGWGMSDNMPRKIAAKKFPKKQLSLVITPDEKAVFANEFHGCKVYLANTSGKKVTINASDSRLDIVLQAQDSEGSWKDIEYTPRSWCGNSYHNVYLQSGEYWDFTMPLYDGADKTKIRAALTYYENKKEKIIYSNAIDGTINPAQFFNKKEYSPNGIMDPYDE